MKTITKKLLVASVAVGVVAPFLTGGAVCAADSSNNDVTVDESNYSGGEIYAGFTDEGDASNNTLNVSNITTNAGQIDAGWSSNGSTFNNITNISNVFAKYAFIHGGYAHGTGISQYNTVNFYSGLAYEIHGGHAISGEATHNTVIFLVEELPVKLAAVILTQEM